MERRQHLSRLIARVCSFIDGTDRKIAFEGLALEIFEFQRKYNPAYRLLCRDALVSDWREIPAVVTSAFKEADWTVLAPEERNLVFYSSGTTAGKRSRHFHSDGTIELYETSLLRWFKPNVMAELETSELWFLTPAPEAAPNSSLVHMFATLARAFGSGTYYGLDREGAWMIDYEKIRNHARKDPVVLCGTAFSFVHLCDWARENGVRLQLTPNSRVMETGGYKGRSRAVAKEELHAMISEVCGVPSARVITEYGMSELSSQAYDHGAGHLFRFPPWARARIISPETGKEAAEGEPGLIRVCDLANVGSVMAVQTEDLGIRREDGFELLGRAALSEPRGCSLMPAA